MPATIGLLNGKIHVGLSDEEIVTMATTQNTVKSSRRDLSWVLSKASISQPIGNFVLFDL